MKNKFIAVTAVISLGYLFQGCEKTEVLKERTVESETKSKEKYLKNGFYEELTYVLDNPDFDHNSRLDNIITAITQEDCNVDLEMATIILEDEFSDILPSISDHTYYDIFTNPEYIRITNYLIEQKLYFNNSISITHLPQILQNYFTKSWMKYH